MENQTSKARSIFSGVIGFWLGGILGSAATYLIAISGFVGWLLGLLPEEQTFVRLLFAIVLAFVTVGVGGIVTGVFKGLSLDRIDTGGDRHRLLAGAGYAYGVGQGILLIPILLLISLIALYNNGPKVQPQAYLLLFGLLGLVYGLIIGFILSLLTVNFRRMWGVLLAVILGYTLGGILLGLYLWQADFITSELVPLRVALRLLFISLLINTPAGALVGLAFHNLAQKRSQLGDTALKPGRIQQIAVIVISLIVLFVVVGFIRDAENFLTVNPAATATQLPSETKGVHWMPATSLPVSSEPEILFPPDISANADNFVGIVWSQELDDDLDILFSFNNEGPGQDGVWSEPINISKSPSMNSNNQQLVIDSLGQAHIVWEENDPDSGVSQIYYSQCQEADCLPPILLSTTPDLDCAAGLERENNRWPSIAIDAGGGLMTAWSAGSGNPLYSTWLVDESPPQEPTGCITTAENMDATYLQPRLAGGSDGVFAVAYTSGGLTESGNIFIQRFENETWSNAGTPIGVGFSPDVMLDTDDQTHVAWCDESGVATHHYSGGSTEKISALTCIGRPELGQDNDGLLHLVWFSDTVENMNGITSPAKLLYESIRTANGWSNPAIVTQTTSPTQPSLASKTDGALHLVWRNTWDEIGAIHYVRQDPYRCEADSLSDLGRVALDTIQDGGFHPPGYQVPFCKNTFIDFVYQPNPEPAFSSDPPKLNGGFDTVAELIDTVQYEVLFVNMQWDADENNLSPGSSFARGVAELYQRIKTDPSKYPRGLLVRILLGNYPEISTLEWGTQIWNVMEDLRDAGVDELENPEIGWKVEIADFAGTWPHSHTKFIVVDGKLLVGAGFNYSWLHLPKDHPSGKGDGLTDLGIVVLGPAAQAAISAYDDMWLGANQLICPDFYLSDEADWSGTCQWQKADVWHVPEVLKYYPTDSQQNAFSLFRTAVYKEADTTYSAVLASAQSTIDAIHVNFSLEMICMANVLVDDVCTYGNALSWMQAIMDAVEQNQVKVRVIVENANSNGLENRVAIKVFKQELAKRGLEDLVEIRFFDGRVHMKSVLIDQELLIVGSQNFHYSSFGEKGLLEYVVASDDPAAIETYQNMFEYYWEKAIPEDQADWATAR